jgi:PiT family inorganic phosphate transporter
MIPLPLAGGVLLGWALGANDSANAYGTAVASRIISLRTATILCGLAVILGAWLQGQPGMHTYRSLAAQDLSTIVVTVVAAALTVVYMTSQKLPVSTSQAVVGAIAGIGLATDTMNWGGLQKVVICWIATPFGAMAIAIVLYYLFGFLLRVIPMGIFTRDKILWFGLILMGLYASYALGANNVANATGVFSGQFSSLGITDQDLVLIGGVSIALGALTFSGRVMMAVGSGIMRLDAFTALVAVTSMAATTHVFALVGVPVSTSQGIVGAIVGIGALRGIRSVQFGVLRQIGIGWVMTPAIALILSAAGYAIFCR